MKKTLSIILTILMIITSVPIAFAAEEYTEGDLIYTVENGEATITRYTAYDNVVVIPDTLGGYPVTTIGDRVFYYFKSITKITIPDSVTTIGVSAFESCESLTEITIPDSVTTIGASAFDSCKSLTEITISGSVTTINDNTFDTCESLTKIIIPDSVTSIGRFAFNKCKNLTEIIIPDSVISIESYAFSECINLTEITIPNSVISIANYVFYKCTNLKEITIPHSVTQFGQYAFFECTALEKVNVPCTWDGSLYAFEDNVIIDNKEHNLATVEHKTPTCTEIGWDFYECTACDYTAYNELPVAPDAHDCTNHYCKICGKVEDGYYAGTCGANDVNDAIWSLDSEGTLTISGEGEYSVPFYDAPWLAYKENIKNVVIEEGITNIPWASFYDLFNTVSLSIPSTVASIDTYYNNGFAEIKLADGNDYYSVVDGVLFNHDKTELMMYPVKKADETYTVPDGVKTLAKNAFDSLDNLKTINISDDVITIGQGCFEKSSIENINFGKNVEVIGHTTFYGTGLKTVVLPEKLTEISTCLFWSCEKLETLVIGNNVKTIEDDSINYCDKLKTVHFTGTEEQWQAITKPADSADPINTIEVHFGAPEEKDGIDATCGEVGHTAGLYCDECNAYITGEVIEALNHKDTLVQADAKAPTCTEIGWEAYEYCTACDYTTYAEKAAHSDTLVQVDAKAPTCTEIGWDAYEYCTACDYTTCVEKAAHSDTLVKVDAKGPTCTEIGWDAYEYCTACDYSTYVEIEALNHKDTLVQVDAKDPTCTEIGWDAYEYCTTCNYSTKVELAIDPDAHNWDDGVLTRPTYVGADGIVGYWQDGYYTYTCEDCSDSYNETVKRADYTAVDVIISDFTDIIRNNNLIDSIIDDLNAIYDENADVVAGNRVESEQAEVDAFVEIMKQKLEEVNAGIEDGSAVLVDGFAIIYNHSSQRVKELSDKYGKDAYNALTDAASDFLLENSEAVEKEAKALTGTVKENEDKIAELISRLDATFFKIENCLMGVHNVLEYKVIEEAECEKNAIGSAVCTLCGETVVREIENSALAHSFTNYETVEEAMCGVAGKEVASCDYGCGATYEKEIEALKHIDADDDYKCDYGCGYEFEKPATPDEPTPDTPDEPDDETCADCGKLHTNFFSEIICFFTRIINFIKNLFA